MMPPVARAVKIQRSIYTCWYEEIWRVRFYVALVNPKEVLQPSHCVHNQFQGALACQDRQMTLLYYEPYKANFVSK